MIRKSSYKILICFLFNVISKTKSFKTPFKSSKTFKLPTNKTNKNTLHWKEKFYKHQKSSLNRDKFISNFIKSSSISMAKTHFKMVFVLFKWEKIKALFQIIKKPLNFSTKESKFSSTKGTKIRNMLLPFMSL